MVFQNGPTSGQDVFIPMDWVIGGQPMLGRGWRMLMECLAAGRGISLPATGAGMAKLAVRATGGYARIRRQFKTPIGMFEGIEEPLARMGGNLYMMDATRVLTARAIDLGEKPAVLSGITKLHLTERARKVVTDAMDIAGGKGICMGPSNFIGSAYMSLPVAITVEGANILTRSLIVFGQGAIRCHPFVLKEIEATREADREMASAAFDKALFGHLRFTLSNLARALVMGLTGSHFVRVPADIAPETRRYYQQLTRFSAALAFLSDRVDGIAGRGVEAQRKAVRAIGRRAVAVVLMLGDAQALRERGPAGRRRAADALGDLGCDVQRANRARRRDLELSQSGDRRADAPNRFPARPPVCDPVRHAGTRSRAFADRAVRDARASHRRHVSVQRYRRSAQHARARACCDDCGATCRD
jgi:acyl-CoA dehydrogenase